MTTSQLALVISDLENAFTMDEIIKQAPYYGWSNRQVGEALCFLREEIMQDLNDDAMNDFLSQLCDYLMLPESTIVYEPTAHYLFVAVGQQESTGCLRQGDTDSLVYELDDGTTIEFHTTTTRNDVTFSRIETHTKNANDVISPAYRNDPNAEEFATMLKRHLGWAFDDIRGHVWDAPIPPRDQWSYEVDQFINHLESL